MNVWVQHGASSDNTRTLQMRVAERKREPDRITKEIEPEGQEGVTGQSEVEESVFPLIETCPGGSTVRGSGKHDRDRRQVGVDSTECPRGRINKVGRVIEVVDDS